MNNRQLAHSAKGTEWKNHKYQSKEKKEYGTRYIYPNPVSSVMKDSESDFDKTTDFIQGIRDKIVSSSKVLQKISDIMNKPIISLYDEDAVLYLGKKKTEEIIAELDDDKKK